MITFAVLTVPVFYEQMSNGLDSSWEYALNKITSWDNIKFGADVVYTYGPLGFLNGPMYVNGIFNVSLFLYLYIWMSVLVMFYKLLKNNCNNIYMIIASLIALLGSTLTTADMYIEYAFLCALAVLWINKNDIYALIFSVIISTIAFFFKFSIAISIIATYILFIFAKICRKEYKRLWGLLLPCITVPLCYLLYNSSIHGFFQFVKGSLEISKGYNSAMSINQSDRYAVWIFLLMAVYVLIMISQIVIRNTNNYLMMFWIAPCYFMSYKHGYVRADGHSLLAYRELLSIFSVMILLYDVRALYKEIINKTKKGIIQFGLILSLMLIVIFNYNVELKPWTVLTSRIQNIPSMFYYMTEDKYQDNLSEIKTIPEEFIETIGKRTYTNYNWEITFIEPLGDMANNYIVLPTLQMFSAYTAYLDSKSASLFGSDNAPEYLIYKFDTIDGRIALLEAPSTWMAIQDNYFMILYDEDTDYYLLKHKDNTTIRDGSSITYRYNKDDTILLDECDEVRIHSKLSIWGKLVSLLWKIPEVDARITYVDGTVREGRVIMDNLSNGITVKALPYDYDTFYNWSFGIGNDSTIVSIEFYGDGFKYYSNIIDVEYVYYNN
jgi:hypothetical protein